MWYTIFNHLGLCQAIFNHFSQVSGVAYKIESTTFRATNSREMVENCLSQSQVVEIFESNLGLAHFLIFCNSYSSTSGSSIGCTAASYTCAHLAISIKKWKTSVNWIQILKNIYYQTKTNRRLTNLIICVLIFEFCLKLDLIAAQCHQLKLMTNSEKLFV